MAKRNEPVEIPEVDRLVDAPLPIERDKLIGHEKTEQALLAAYRSERFHHAWILGGPKGIGKATLAFRFARFAIANPDRMGSAVNFSKNLDVPLDHPVSRQFLSGGHPNLLHLRRPWDEKGKRFKSDLPVDEVRRTVSFFGTSASSNAWRICIVDAADDMNASSANALLKILEEPPKRCLFLVLSHMPGRLLPTIKSRCRRLDLQPLTDDQIKQGVRELGSSSEDLDEQALSEIAQGADGSLRTALNLQSGDGLTILRLFKQLAENARNLDLAKVHALADLVSARGQSDNWSNFQHVLQKWQHDHLRLSLQQSLANAHDRVGLWERMNKSIRDAEALNLDRKQVVLDFFLQLKAQGL